MIVSFSTEFLHLLLANFVLSVALLSILLVLRKWIKSPALTHAFCVLILVKLVTPPLIFVSVPLFQSDPVVAPRVDSASSPIRQPKNEFAQPPAEPVNELPHDLLALNELAGISKPHESIYPASEENGKSFGMSAMAVDGVAAFLLAVWVTGCLLMIGLTIWRIKQFFKFLSLATPAPVRLRRIFSETADELGIRTPPTIEVIPGLGSPVLTGVPFKSKIVVPEQLIDSVDDAQLKTIVFHELVSPIANRRTSLALELTTRIGICRFPMRIPSSPSNDLFRIGVFTNGRYGAIL